MPNHVTTQITGPQEALSSLLNDGGKVDFNVLIPEPPNIEKGGCSGEHEPGVVCWYSWNIDNWGTKWGAYDSEVEIGKVRFDTAWSHPAPIMAALTAKHPDVEFEVKYADEDLGYNLGHYTLRGGQMVEHEIEDPHEFAAQLKYGMSYKEVTEY